MIEEDLRAALCEVMDPETGINLVDLGLIYDAHRTGEGAVSVTMTLTTPACPAGGTMIDGVERRLLRIDGVRTVDVELTFDPPWTPDAITQAGRAALGWA